MLNSHLSISEPHHRLSTLVREKSWHLLPILFRIGHPALPEELASKCKLFDPSPDFVRYLCSIPGSPIHLLENGLVTVSMSAILAFKEFVAKAVNGGTVSRFGIRVLESNRVWNCNLKTCFRKRKGVALDGLVVSIAKRRLSFPAGNGGMHFPLILIFLISSLF